MAISSALGTVCMGPGRANDIPKLTVVLSALSLAIPHPHLRRVGILPYLPPDPSVPYTPTGHSPTVRSSPEKLLANGLFG